MSFVTDGNAAPTAYTHAPYSNQYQGQTRSSSEIGFFINAAPNADTALILAEAIERHVGNLSVFIGADIATVNSALVRNERHKLPSNFRFKSRTVKTAVGPVQGILKNAPRDDAGATAVVHGAWNKIIGMLARNSVPTFFCNVARAARPFSVRRVEEEGVARTIVSCPLDQQKQLVTEVISLAETASKRSLTALLGGTELGMSYLADLTGAAIAFARKGALADAWETYGLNPTAKLIGDKKSSELFIRNATGPFFSLRSTDDGVADRILEATFNMLSADRADPLFAEATIWHDALLNDVDDVFANAAINSVTVPGKVAEFVNWEVAPIRGPDPIWPEEILRMYHREH